MKYIINIKNNNEIKTLIINDFEGLEQIIKIFNSNGVNYEVITQEIKTIETKTETKPTKWVTAKEVKRTVKKTPKKATGWGKVKSFLDNATDGFNNSIDRQKRGF